MRYNKMNLAVVLIFLSFSCKTKDNHYDIVVYGGSPAGITAAIQASKMGKDVVLIAPEGRIGGLTASGLGATDMGNKEAIGGLAKSFYERVREHYFSDPSAWRQETLEEYRRHAYKTGIDDEAMWFFEPHVAYDIFSEMLSEANVKVILTERLDLRDGVGVRKASNEIRAIQMESGSVYYGKVFIDATYEGDLMAKAGVTYTVGRESNSQYGETVNGIIFQPELNNGHHFVRKVDPYVIPGNPASGLIYGVQEPRPPGGNGEGDHRVQSYCFRLCMTDVKENQVPFPKPADYDPAKYELLLRYFKSEEKFPWVSREEAAKLVHPALKWDPYIKLMPNRKTDSNTNGPISFNLVGGNYGYPEGNYEERERIVQEHKSWQQGLIWFVANDPKVPAEYREHLRGWGLAKDEFTDNDNWPPQLYIREARRMVGSYVMTEHNCTGSRDAGNSIGLGSYNMDRHICGRYVHTDGWVRNDGKIAKYTDKPYPISYYSVVPQKEECSNLLVPVCMSASHVAYGSIRMEPVYMILGQSAGMAAAAAIDDKTAVQEVDYGKLRRQLIDAGQVLSWEQ